MAAILNISIDQGSDFLRVITVKSDATTPIDLTGFSFAGEARASYLDTDPAFTFVFTIKSQLTNIGEVEWTLPNAALTGIALKASKDYLYDIEMTDPDLKKTRILQGKVTVVPEVTKIG
jgi:hypothetical protein